MRESAKLALQNHIGGVQNSQASYSRGRLKTRGIISQKFHRNFTKFIDPPDAALATKFGEWHLIAKTGSYGTDI